VTWAALLVASAATYGLKLAGLTVPRRVLEGPRTQRFAELLPVALLMALVAVGAFATGHTLVLDARAAGLAVAAVALRLRVGFAGVVILAAGTAAVLRAAGVG
jgi:branched-subunit amino acid transport protein